MRRITWFQRGSALLCCGALGFLGLHAHDRTAQTTIPVLQVHGDSIVYATLSELEEAADIIAFVRPVTPFLGREHVNSFYSDGAIQDFYTKSRVDMLKTFKDVNGAVGAARTFEMIEPVGLVEQGSRRLKLQIEGYSETESGKTYLVFLKSNGLGGYSVINMNNGKIISDKTQEIAQDVEEIGIDGLKLRAEARGRYRL